jgi:hypothetical protein
LFFEKRKPFSEVYTRDAELLGKENGCIYHSAVNELLRICGLTVQLPATAGWVRPVNGVSLRIAAGECVGLVGEREGDVVVDVDGIVAGGGAS